MSENFNTAFCHSFINRAYRTRLISNEERRKLIEVVFFLLANPIAVFKELKNGDVYQTQQVSEYTGEFKKHKIELFLSKGWYREWKEYLSPEGWNLLNRIWQVFIDSFTKNGVLISETDKPFGIYFLRVDDSILFEYKHTILKKPSRRTDDYIDDNDNTDKYINDNTDKYIDICRWIANIKNEKEKEILVSAEAILNFAMRDIRLRKLKERDYHILRTGFEKESPIITGKRPLRPLTAFFSEDFFNEIRLCSLDCWGILRDMWFELKEYLAEENILISESVNEKNYSIHFLRVDKYVSFRYIK